MIMEETVKSTLTSKVPQTLLDECARQHQTVCPRQILGLRMGMLAGELFAVEFPQQDKRIFAFLETDGCFANGITIATGCSVGHRTMRMIDYGKIAATFVDKQSGRTIRIRPQHNVRELAAVYAPQERSRWHKQLLGYQIMPTDELLHVEDVDRTIALAAIVSEPGRRTTCHHCGEEIINGREVKSDSLTLCRHCSGESYYLSPSHD